MSKQLKVLNPQPFPKGDKNYIDKFSLTKDCLLYTSPSPRD